MLKSTLIAGGLALALMNTSPGTAESNPAVLDLEPAINGAVSASGLFPAQHIEDAFSAYLDWTKEQGISRLAAFESRPGHLEGGLDEAGSRSGRFPSQAMEDSFVAYVQWIDRAGLSPFYAFKVTDFD